MSGGVCKTLSPGAGQGFGTGCFSVDSCRMAETMHRELLVGSKVVHFLVSRERASSLGPLWRYYMLWETRY